MLDKDLAEDSISNQELETDKAILKEEKQRRRWKGILLFITTLTIVVFYISFLLAIFCTQLHQEVHVVISLAAVPTILTIVLMRILSKPNNSLSDSDVSENPWFTLLEELVDVLKDKLSS